MSSESLQSTKDSQRHDWVALIMAPWGFLQHQSHSLSASHFCSVLSLRRSQSLVRQGTVRIEEMEHWGWSESLGAHLAMIPLYISPLIGEIVSGWGSRATVSAVRRMPSLPLSGTDLYGPNYTFQLCFQHCGLESWASQNQRVLRFMALGMRSVCKRVSYYTAGLRRKQGHSLTVFVP